MLGHFGTVAIEASARFRGAGIDPTPQPARAGDSLGLIRARAIRLAAAAGGARETPPGPGRDGIGAAISAASLARDLALHALHVEVDAAQNGVVGDRVLGQHRLVVFAGDRAVPDHEAAVLEASLDLLDLFLGLGRHLVADRDDVDRAFLDAPPDAAAAGPGAFQRASRVTLMLLGRPVDGGAGQVRFGA